LRPLKTPKSVAPSDRGVQYSTGIQGILRMFVMPRLNVLLDRLNGSSGSTPAWSVIGHQNRSLLTRCKLPGSGHSRSTNATRNYCLTLLIGLSPPVIAVASVSFHKKWKTWRPRSASDGGKAATMVKEMHERHREGTECI